MKQLYWFFLGGFACWLPIAIVEMLTHDSIVALYDPLGLLLSIIIPSCTVYVAYSRLRGRGAGGLQPVLWMIAGTQVLAAPILEPGAISWRGALPPSAGMNETAFILMCSIPLLNLYYVGTTGKLFGLLSADLLLILSGRRLAGQFTPRERRS